MSAARAPGVVVDTMVISWLFADQPHPLAARYRELIAGRPVLLAFQTVMELRYGARRAGWGDLRRRRLERDIAQVAVVQADDELATVCADLRHRCQQIGHALADKIHDGDRWVAAAAIRLGIPLVSHDGVFDRTPGLELLTARD
ncbi:MAG TPA: PIN domain-containing protein [Acidimicrobiales bacterium]